MIDDDGGRNKSGFTLTLCDSCNIDIFALWFFSQRFSYSGLLFFVR